MYDKFVYSHPVQLCEVRIDPRFNSCISFKILASETHLFVQKQMTVDRATLEESH